MDVLEFMLNGLGFMILLGVGIVILVIGLQLAGVIVAIFPFILVIYLT